MAELLLLRFKAVAEASRIISMISSFLLCLMLSTSCSSGSNDAATTPAATTATSTSILAVTTAPDVWVVAWGASPENATTGPSNPGGAEQTFRSFFYPSVSGATERVRFSNYLGTAPVTIGAARLAIATTPPAVDAAHDVALLFNGSATVTIAPGAEVSSDPVNLTYAFGEKRVVAIADFEAALADPDHPDFLVPTFNSGDNFHPNGAGYQAKAQAIPISAILP